MLYSNGVATEGRVFNEPLLLHHKVATHQNMWPNEQSSLHEKASEQCGIYLKPFRFNILKVASAIAEFAGVLRAVPKSLLGCACSWLALVGCI